MGGRCDEIGSGWFCVFLFVAEHTPGTVVLLFRAVGDEGFGEGVGVWEWICEMLVFDDFKIFQGGISDGFCGGRDDAGFQIKFVANDFEVLPEMFGFDRS